MTNCFLLYEYYYPETCSKKLEKLCSFSQSLNSLNEITFNPSYHLVRAQCDVRIQCVLLYYCAIHHIKELFSRFKWFPLVNTH